MVLCECGEVVGRDKIKEYIKTTRNPSTPTFGHSKCGVIFNFVDCDHYTAYSSRKDLKVRAGEFAEIIGMNPEDNGKFMLEVERLKSKGNLTDHMILSKAYERTHKCHD